MRNPLVDLLRFILIFWIVLFHYTAGYNCINGVEPVLFPHIFGHGGACGTTLFFILSGYLMGHSLLLCVTKGLPDGVKSYGAYCVKRYWRLWPAYAMTVLLITVWLLVLPLPFKDIGVAKFFVNLLLIVHPGGYVDGAHWFLMALYEVQCFTMLLIFTPPIGA